jgi:hypothetical protein
MQLKDVRYVLIEKILRLLSLSIFFWVVVPNGIGDVDLAGDLGLIVGSSGWVQLLSTTFSHLRDLEGEMGRRILLRLRRILVFLVALVSGTSLVGTSVTLIYMWIFELISAEGLVDGMIFFGLTRGTMEGGVSLLAEVGAGRVDFRLLFVNVLFYLFTASILRILQKGVLRIPLISAGSLAMSCRSNENSLVRKRLLELRVKSSYLPFTLMHYNQLGLVGQAILTRVEALVGTGLILSSNSQTLYHFFFFLFCLACSLLGIRKGYQSIFPVRRILSTLESSSFSLLEVENGAANYLADTVELLSFVAGILILFLKFVQITLEEFTGLEIFTDIFLTSSVVGFVEQLNLKTEEYSMEKMYLDLKTTE